MHNNRYTLKFRRRREGRTNYHKRLRLLQSRKARLVIRKTNSHIIVQFVSYEPDGDRVVAQAATNQLPALGWKGHTGNVPAAYLAGYLAGARARKAGVKEAVVDIGMQHAHAGGRLFAAVKGALDADISIPVDEQVLPDEDRIHGKHIDEKMGGSVDKIKKEAGA